MEFEWDPEKAERNMVKHGVSFEYAARVFLDPSRVDIQDRRRNYSEERRVLLGKIDQRVFAIAYTSRRGVSRIISARKANPREQRHYEAFYTQSE
jgi:uncharacterized DUF497 family protein